MLFNIEISFNSFQAKHLFPAKQKHYLKSELAVFEKWPILTNTRWMQRKMFCQVQSTFIQLSKAEFIDENWTNNLFGT